jgi:hypothetical protein
MSRVPGVIGQLGVSPDGDAVQSFGLAGRGTLSRSTGMRSCPVDGPGLPPGMVPGRAPTYDALADLTPEAIEPLLPHLALSPSVPVNFSSERMRRAYGRLVAAIGLSQLTVREAGGNNRGAEVEDFQRTAGGAAGHPWCAAFVYWCHERAANMLGARTTCPRTMAAVNMWYLGRTGCQRFTRAQVEAGQATPEPGDIFIMAGTSASQAAARSAILGRDRGEFFPSHTGLVVSYTGGSTPVLVTVEGNTNTSGGREGIGVFRRTSRWGATLYGFTRAGYAPV